MLQLGRASSMPLASVPFPISALATLAPSRSALRMTSSAERTGAEEHCDLSRRHAVGGDRANRSEPTAVRVRAVHECSRLRSSENSWGTRPRGLRRRSQLARTGRSSSSGGQHTTEPRSMPASTIATFATLKLTLGTGAGRMSRSICGRGSNWRKLTEVAIQFKPTPHLMFSRAEVRATRALASSSCSPMKGSCRRRRQSSPALSSPYEPSGWSFVMPRRSADTSRRERTVALPRREGHLIQRDGVDATSPA